MKNTVISFVSVMALGVGLAPAALAADMPVKALPPPLPPPCEWCGFYIGINYGGSIGQSPTTATGTSNIPVAGFGVNTYNSESYTHAARGALVGGQIGYNWQWSPHWVWGVEVDSSWTGETDTVHSFGCGATNVGFFGGGGTGFNTCLSDEQKLSYFGTARARFGWATSDYYWYWTGGAAWGTVKENLGFSSVTVIPGANLLCPGAGGNPTCGSGGSFSNNKAGWTIGSGVEVKLWMPGWTAKFEYLYVDLGSFTDTVINPATTISAAGTNTVSVSSHFRDNIIRGGINYRF